MAHNLMNAWPAQSLFSQSLLTEMNIVQLNLSSRLINPEQSLNPGHSSVMNAMTSGLCLNTDAPMVLLSGFPDLSGICTVTIFEAVWTQGIACLLRDRKSIVSSFPPMSFSPHQGRCHLIGRSLRGTGEAGSVIQQHPVCLCRVLGSPHRTRPRQYNAKH